MIGPRCKYERRPLETRLVSATAISQTYLLGATREHYIARNVIARGTLHSALRLVSCAVWGVKSLELGLKGFWGGGRTTGCPKMSGGKCFLRDFEPCDSSSHSSMISTRLRDMEDLTEHSVEYEKCSVFHCASSKCNLVLGDSLAACGEVSSLRCIICLSEYFSYFIYVCVFLDLFYIFNSS